MSAIRGHFVDTAVVFVIAASLGWGAPAVAAEEGEQPAQSEEAESGAVEIEEIVVTARKRDEPLQDVPLAVTAFDQATLESSFQPRLQYLDRYSPNVEFGGMQFAAGGMTASIRGVSFGDLERTFEPAVGISVDGVFLGTNTGAMIDLMDIETIDILRGPQGTLFGRNTIGGTVNIRRSEPTGELGARVSATIGSFARNDYRVVFNAPIKKEKAALKLGFFSVNGDSHTSNIDTGERDGGLDKMMFSGALLMTPTDNFEALLSVDYVDDQSEYPGLTNMSLEGNLVCDFGLGCADTSWDITRESGFDVSFSSQPFLATLESTSMALKMTWDVGDYTLKSITGYSDVTDDMEVEATGAQDLAPGLPLVFVDRHQTYEQTSQEFSITSNLGGRLNFVGGLYYFTSEYMMDPQEAFFAGGPAGHFIARQKLDAYAAYAEGYYDLNERTQFTLGGRYTWEEKDFSITHFDLTDPSQIRFTCPDPTIEGPCSDPVGDWSKFTPRFSITHRFNDAMMLYGTYSTGFRSGGWSGRAASPNGIGPYEPETLDNIELGMRSDLLSRRLRLNVTLFHAKYKDKQEEVLRTFNLQTETIVENASSATIKGIEIEGQALLTSALRMWYALGYMDAGYDKFEVEGVDLRSIKNYRWTPEKSLNLGLDYTLETGAGRIVFGANYKYTDDFLVSPEVDPLGLNRDVIASYNTFDASATFFGVMGKSTDYRVSLFVNNAFNDDGRLFRTLNAGAYWFGSQEPGRTVGLELTFDF